MWTSLWARFLRSRAGNFAISAAVVAPVLLGATGLAVDYASIYKHRKELQESADGAALASVRELMLAGSQDGQIIQISKNYAKANASAYLDSAVGMLDVDTVINREANEIKVTLSYTWTPMFAHFLDASATPIVAEATAKLAGRGLTCVVGLMEPQTRAKSSIHLDNNSVLVAKNCGVFSNSDHRYGLRVDNRAKITAQTICSAGGIYKRFGRNVSFDPEPLLDCPKIADPLQNRTGPTPGGCREKNLVISEDTLLKPGTYCGGITARDSAKVTFEKGIFIIKDGPLIVTDTASLTGKGVSFYLTGDNSIIEFDGGTTIDLEATTSGILAGILFFEDRNVPHSFDFDPFHLDNLPDDVRLHRISSNNARNLLGTLYLKNSILLINANAPVADAAAYTALVVGRLWLQKGPVLHLNADYTKTEVPVPDGLIGQKPVLTN